MAGEYLDQLNECHLLKDSAPWSWLFGRSTDAFRVGLRCSQTRRHPSHIRCC